MSEEAGFKGIIALDNGVFDILSWKFNNKFYVESKKATFSEHLGDLGPFPGQPPHLKLIKMGPSFSLCPAQCWAS